MSATDDLVANARRYEAGFTFGDLPLPPARGVTVVTCMDARINLYALLGVAEGDAHMLRNAGGVVTQDTLRSLAVSQRLLGTKEIMLIHHTECGLENMDSEAFLAGLEAEVGQRPTWRPEAFTDLEADVRESVARVQADPFIPHKDSVRGFVYDVKTGALREV